MRATPTRGALSRTAVALVASCVASIMMWSPHDPSGLAAQSRSAGAAKTATPTVAGYSFDIIAQYARPTDAYTQGFAFHQGQLFEGTGLYGESRLRETVLERGVQRVIRSRPLPEGVGYSEDQRGFRSRSLSRNGYSDGQMSSRTFQDSVFGEGIAIKDGRIYQLTWVEGVCFVWDVSNWTAPAKTFRYTGEGWGLTHDGTHLIMSDGSDTLSFRQADTFAVVRQLKVFDPRRKTPVRLLNELEYVDGQIFANIYTTRQVAIIDPRSGYVTGYVFFDGAELPASVPRQPSLMPSGLWTQFDLRGEVLNGIAYDPRTKRLVVTGKKWPTVYEIKLRRVVEAL